MPLTRNVVVDRDAVLDLVDQLRVAIPEEVRAAKRINSEGERIIEKADEEATRIISRAQEQAAFLIGERGLLELAEEEGRRIIGEAQEAGDEVRAGADEYALQILGTLESEVARALAGIQKGMTVLDDRRAELAEGEAAATDDEAYEDDDPGEPLDEEDEDARHPAYR
ncbi:MAG: ATPase [Chloroflexota bacterium]|nr:MAG: ATPase [Chloroflexota bacterium]